MFVTEGDSESRRKGRKATETKYMAVMFVAKEISKSDLAKRNTEK